MYNVVLRLIPSASIYKLHDEVIQTILIYERIWKQS